MKSLYRISSITLMTILLSACQTVYYDAMEKIGIHKRDIMIDRVEDARNSQQSAKKQFASALEEFQELLGNPESSLQGKYNNLNDAYADSKAAADKVSERIQSVESVSEALFAEWQNELSLYSSQTLRRDSSRKLQQTRSRYNQLIAAMRKAESRMQPVLNTFQDQVLYLKHNLNARAIESLEGELGNIELDVARLIEEMESAIDEAETFIQTLQQA